MSAESNEGSGAAAPRAPPERLTDERLEEILRTPIGAPRGTQRDIANLVWEVRHLRMMDAELAAILDNGRSTADGQVRDTLEHGDEVMAAFYRGRRDACNSALTVMCEGLVRADECAHGYRPPGRCPNGCATLPKGDESDANDRVATVASNAAHGTPSSGVAPAAPTTGRFEGWESKYLRALVLALLKMLSDAEWCQECAVAKDPLVAQVRAAFAETARDDSGRPPDNEIAAQVRRDNGED